MGPPEAKLGSARFMFLNLESLTFMFYVISWFISSVFDTRCLSLLFLVFAISVSVTNKLRVFLIVYRIISCGVIALAHFLSIRLEGEYNLISWTKHGATRAVNIIPSVARMLKPSPRMTNLAVAIYHPCNVSNFNVQSAALNSQKLTRRFIWHADLCSRTSNSCHENLPMG